MVALNEELSGIAGEPQARSGCGAAEGAMTFPPKNRSNPRSIPYCSDSYLPDSGFSRHYARNRNYSPSLESVLRQEPKSRLSTGVAHREINQDPAGYPGAAALSRGVGTGFRGVDAKHNCGEHRSPPLNIDGANTYQFVMSNPVGNVDPWGLSTACQVQTWFEDSYHQFVPGGEFADAVGALPSVLRIWVASKAQKIAANETGQCPTNGPGPLYNGMAYMLNGNAMSPQEHQAVQNWLNTATSQPLLPWLWTQIKIGWARL